MRQLSAIIEREDDVYVALCPEVDIASQGQTVEIARMNLIEALELFFESEDQTEIARRLHSEVFVARAEAWLEAFSKVSLLSPSVRQRESPARAEAHAGNADGMPPSNGTRETPLRRRSLGRITADVTSA
jgi:predicted RNase H-like HicB family nuclease